MTTAHRAFARRLRAAATEPEDIVWQALRDRKLGGAKFRRQVPLGRYVVDFLCIDAKLIVEIDGKQYEWRAGYDANRTTDLSALGFTVLQFSNVAVIETRDDVFAAIAAALAVRL